MVVHRNEMNRRADATVGERVDHVIAVHPELIVDPHDVEVPGVPVPERPRRQFDAGNFRELLVVEVGNLNTTLLPAIEAA